MAAALSTWWRYRMETFSALLVFCAGNSPVTGEFPAQRPVTRSFGVFFDLHLNQQLSKQWRRRWFETQTKVPMSQFDQFVTQWQTVVAFTYFTKIITHSSNYRKVDYIDKGWTSWCWWTLDIQSNCEIGRHFDPCNKDQHMIIIPRSMTKRQSWSPVRGWTDRDGLNLDCWFIRLDCPCDSHGREWHWPSRM